MEEMNAEEITPEEFLKSTESEDFGLHLSPEDWLKVFNHMLDFAKHYHAQQSKGMYTEEEVAEAAFNSWTECYKQNRRTDAPYDKVARLYSNQTFEQYWESIKPKK